MKLSTAGAHLIEGFEGFSSKPYRDAVGVWTIGYGSTKNVGPNTPHVSRAQAEARLKREVDDEYGAAINRLRLPLNQNQYDALVSFVYNVGPGGIAASTGVGRALRRYDWHGAANALLAWDKAGGQTLLGLTRRRQAERALFLKTDRWAGYKADELRWMREWDRHPSPKRRRVLRRVMGARAKQLRALPLTTIRRRRIRSLEARS